MKKLIFLSVLLPLVSFAKVGGQYLFDVNIYRASSKVELNSGGASESTVSIYDFKLGMFSNNWYYGAMYTTRSNSSTGLEDETGNAMGVGLGYFADWGGYAMLHYILSATYDDYSKGTGYQYDFGYIFDVNGTFHLGGVLSTRTIKYTEHEISAIDSYDVTQTLPMLVAGFHF